MTSMGRGVSSFAKSTATGLPPVGGLACCGQGVYCLPFASHPPPVAFAGCVAAAVAKTAST